MLRNLLTELRELRDDVSASARSLDPSRLAPDFRGSGTNLARYLALRRHDVRPLQHRLAELGLSSLGRIETHVEPSLDAVIAVLEVLSGERHELPLPSATPRLDDAFRLIEGHAEALFGPKPAERHVRIMVTLPSEAADDSALVSSLAHAGMDIARINCAHDDPEAWRRMAHHVARAGRDVGRAIKVSMDLAGPKIRTGAPAKGDFVRLHTGDRLIVTRSCEPGGGGKHALRIGCMLPEALRDIDVGQAVFFDDGKCGGIVRRVRAESIEVEITRAREKGVKLGPDKGINLPNLRIDLPAVTDADRRDLRTVVEIADIVCVSFTQSARDVQSLREALAGLGHPDLGVVAKIETRTGFEALPSILMALMEGASAGVMIARGDLAVEVGYERLAEVQEEMLWLCEAAHMPVIWATQVLESLAKKGLPSRAEITDAAMGERAECVMLNKGPYVGEAVAALDGILRRMAGHQRKKTALLRPLASFG